MDSYFFKTKDGVKLHYLIGGQGSPTLMLPGGSFSVGIFKEQFKDLSQHYQLYALDQRGHGLSDKPAFGYRIARLSKDLHELITALDLNELNLIGHSLGASVIYSYIDLYGTSRINKLVLIDEPCILLNNPVWTKDTQKHLGAIYEPAAIHNLLNQFLGKDVLSFKRQLIDQMTTKYANKELKEYLFTCMTLPNQATADLFLNNICQDFRDILAKIDVSTLFITGTGSYLPIQAFKWMQQHVSDAKLDIFDENEGGSHFMFIENPKKFNNSVINFLQAK